MPLVCTHGEHDWSLWKRVGKAVEYRACYRRPCAAIEYRDVPFIPAQRNPLRSC